MAADTGRCGQPSLARAAVLVPVYTIFNLFVVVDT